MLLSTEQYLKSLYKSLFVAPVTDNLTGRTDLVNLELFAGCRVEGCVQPYLAWPPASAQLNSVSPSGYRGATVFRVSDTRDQEQTIINLHSDRKSVWDDQTVNSCDSLERTLFFLVRDGLHLSKRE